MKGNKKSGRKNEDRETVIERVRRWHKEDGWEMNGCIPLWVCQALWLEKLIIRAALFGRSTVTCLRGAEMLWQMWTTLREARRCVLKGREWDPYRETHFICSLPSSVKAWCAFRKNSTSLLLLRWQYLDVESYQDMSKSCHIVSASDIPPKTCTKAMLFINTLFFTLKFAFAFANLHQMWLQKSTAKNTNQDCWTIAFHDQFLCVCVFTYFKEVSGHFQ